MPQIAPIVVDFTPVVPGTAKQVVFDPLGTKDGLTSYSGEDGVAVVVMTLDGGVPVATPVSSVLQKTLTISLNRPSKTSRISKVRVKVVAPVAALDATGRQTAAKSHENSADVTYLFSEKSTEGERSELDGLFQAILTGPELIAVIQKLKSMY